MVPLLSELWRFAQYLLRPEDHSDTAQGRPGPASDSAASAQRTAAPRAYAWEDRPLAGALKTLFWACLAVLAGLALGRLGGG
jgi:hypothetical protein